MCTGIQRIISEFNPESFELCEKKHGWECSAKKNGISFFVVGETQEEAINKIIRMAVEN
jgi:hypothetical protein